MDKKECVVCNGLLYENWFRTKESDTCTICEENIEKEKKDK